MLGHKRIFKLKIRIEELERQIFDAKKDNKLAFASRLELIKEKEKDKLTNWVRALSD